jgi:ribosomal protein S18 acetylase RimI-like enzyme
MGRPRVELLTRSHKPLLKDFRNQHQLLVNYIQRYALRHMEKDRLSRTFVAIDVDDGEERLAGFFSLAAVSVERSSVADIPALERLPRFPIPGVLLAQLAVDQRAQGQGLGRYLFDEALGHVMQLQRDGPVGFRLFVADAIDEQAAAFYERRGFVRLSDDFPARMVLDLVALGA